MKTRRIIFFFICFVMIFVLIFLSSSFFSLQEVELCLFEESGNNSIKFYQKIYCCDTKSVYDDFGKSVFKIKTQNYIRPFEEDNPEYKVLKVDIKIPNKVVFNVFRRKEIFCILSKDVGFVLDEEFKVLRKENDLEKLVTNFVFIGGQKEGGSVLNFFDFFDLNVSCCYEGYFLDENNILIREIKNFCLLLKEFGLEAQIFETITFREEKESVDLVLKTNNNYGVKIIMENVFDNFNRKLKKVIEMFVDLRRTQKIKTTFGKIVVNDELVCSFFYN